MLNTIKSLVSKSWKSNKSDLEPGTHYFDQEFLVHIQGTVEKRPDELAAPTVSIPLIPALAFFWEKAGISRDSALVILRDALREAMQKNVKEDEQRRLPSSLDCFQRCGSRNRLAEVEERFVVIHCNHVGFLWGNASLASLVRLHLLTFTANSKR